MGNRLYVGNLSFNTNEADLVAAFEQDGRKVASAQVVMDRDTGRSRGFAFVEMANANDTQAAIKAMDGVQMDGRALRVNEAEERKPRTEVVVTAGTVAAVGASGTAGSSSDGIPSRCQRGELLAHWPRSLL
jgi:RNA recognition motif-containing protein